MKLKMAQLVEKTGVPKSTILYYIKEGLLPQPQKLKQNVCLYDPEYVERIKFLKFLQQNYGKSIAELKAAVCAHEYDFSKGSDILIDFLEKLSGTKADSAKMNIVQLSEYTGVDQGLIMELIAKKILVPMIEGIYDEKDAQMAVIFAKLIASGWSIDFFERYSKLAGELASFSSGKILEMKKRLKEEGDVDNQNYHLMFDLALNVQPYIINRLGILEHKKVGQNGLEEGSEKG